MIYVNSLFKSYITYGIIFKGIGAKMEKHIKLFLEFLQDDKKLSDNTLQSYKRDIEQYRDYIQENRINYLKVDGEDLQEYLKKLQEMGKENFYYF